MATILDSGDIEHSHHCRRFHGSPDLKKCSYKNLLSVHHRNDVAIQTLTVSTLVPTSFSCQHLNNALRNKICFNLHLKIITEAEHLPMWPFVFIFVVESTELHLL